MNNGWRILKPSSMKTKIPSKLNLKPKALIIALVKLGLYTFPNFVTDDLYSNSLFHSLKEFKQKFVEI